MFENKKYKNTVFLIQNKFYKLKNNFVIITAYNPMDNLLKEKENKAKNCLLYHSLKPLGKEIIFITGSSPQKTHQEPSFLIDISLNQGLRFARAFQQRAIFWCKNNNLQIVYCENLFKLNIGKFTNRIEII
jgi:hypothetical protein